MRLVRNTTTDGSGKYMLVKQRRVREILSWQEGDVDRARTITALRDLKNIGVIDDPSEGEEGEFFVIRLRDKYAREALNAYAFAANFDDPEYADEVMALAARAGPNSQFMKRPD